MIGTPGFGCVSRLLVKSTERKPDKWGVISTVAPLLSCESKKRGEAESPEGKSALSSGLLTEKADLSTWPYGLGRGDKGDQPLSIEIIGNTIVSTSPTNLTCTPGFLKVLIQSSFEALF
jgi:hypothetical protein